MFAVEKNGNEGGLGIGGRLLSGRRFRTGGRVVEMMLNALLHDGNTATEDACGLAEGFIVVQNEFGGASNQRNVGGNH